jgi:hypothetical protein
MFVYLVIARCVSNSMNMSVMVKLDLHSTSLFIVSLLRGYRSRTCSIPGVRYPEMITNSTKMHNFWDRAIRLVV